MLASLWRGSTLFCTLEGKSQNLFGCKNRSMRSRLFSYYPGYSLLYDDITKTHVDKIEFPECRQIINYLGSRGYFFLSTLIVRCEAASTRCEAPRGKQPSREPYQTASTVYFIKGILRTDIWGQGNYKGGQCLVNRYIYFLDVCSCLWK